MTTIKRRKTYVAKPPDIRPVWHLIDATEKPLGRLASEIATLLMGKHRPIYTPTIMTGDFVVVVNAAKVGVTGKKLTQKQYHFHSGYPGGLRSVTLERMLQRSPPKVLELAVKGMLPKTTLGGRMLKRLKVYANESHPHEAQIKGYGAPVFEDPEGQGSDA
jgi:large subunit ribosomal protein L13